MITKDLFNSLFPTKGLTSAKNLKRFNLVRRRDELIAAMNKILPKYQIDNYFRICAFFSNCGIETDYFKTTKEYASGWDYDISVNPRKARGLGNLSEGDGPKYKGSGLSQTTGKNNFKAVQKAIGKLLDVDVVEHPEILRENIEVAVESACIFWRDNKLNFYADRGRFKELSGIVNRGDRKKTPLHWMKRNALYKICLVTVPRDFRFDQPVIASNDGEKSATVVLTPAENNSPESLAVPPVQPASENQPAEAAGETNLDKSQLKEIAEKLFRHCKNDSVKNILFVVGFRISAVVVAIWRAGLHGKIFLIVAAIAVVFFITRAIYIYLPRLIGWARNMLNSFLSE